MIGSAPREHHRQALPGGRGRTLTPVRSGTVPRLRRLRSKAVLERGAAFHGYQRFTSSTTACPEMRACSNAQHRPSVNKHASMMSTTQMNALWFERLNQPQLVNSQTIAAKKARPMATPNVPKDRQVACKANSHS